MSPRAQQRKHFAVQSLPDQDSGSDDNSTIEALRDNTKSPPDEQAAFRIDFPAWLARLGEQAAARAAPAAAPLPVPAPAAPAGPTLRQGSLHDR